MKFYHCIVVHLQRSHHELSIAVEKENMFENKPSINLMGLHLSKEVKQSFIKYSKHKIFIYIQYEIFNTQKSKKKLCEYCTSRNLCFGFYHVFNNI